MYGDVNNGFDFMMMILLHGYLFDLKFIFWKTTEWESFLYLDSADTEKMEMNAVDCVCFPVINQLKVSQLFQLSKS